MLSFNVKRETIENGQISQKPPPSISFKITYFKVSHLNSRPARVVLWSPHWTFKLGGQGSSLGRTSTQGLKIIEGKGLPLH